MTGNRALFLDRDGVINHDSGYTNDQASFIFIEGIFDLCRAARKFGYLLIVVTNQAGIGRGYYSEEDFFVLTRWMCKQFESEGAPISDVFHCPYHPEHGVGAYRKDSFDRKPNPGMLLSAAEKYKLDMGSSIMIGDKVSDMQAALAARVGTRCSYNANESLFFQSSTHHIKHLCEAINLLS